MVEYALRIPRIMVMTRVLGPEFYGVLGLFAVFREILGKLMGLGTGDAVIQFLAESKKKSEETRMAATLSAANWVRFIMVLFSITLVFFGEDYFVEWISTFPAVSEISIGQLIWLIRLLLIGVFVQAIEAPFGNALQGFQAWRALLVVRILGAFASTLMPIGAALLGFGIVGIVFAQQAAFALMAVFILIAYIKIVRPFLKTPQFREKLTLCREILRFGLPLVFSSFFFMIYTYTDNLMLASMGNGPEDLSFYELARNLTAILLFAPTLIRSVMFPATAEFFSEVNIPRLEALFAFMFKHLFLSMLPVCACFSVFSSVIIQIVSGEKFLEASPGLAFLALLIIFRALGVPLFTCLVGAFRATDKQFIITLIGGILNVILNFFFIPKFGYMGAIYATAIGYFVSLPLGFYFLSKNMKIIVPWKTLLSSVIACVFIVAVLELCLRFNLFLAIGFIPFMGLLYAYLVIRWGAFDMQDFERASFIIERIPSKLVFVKNFLFRNAKPVTKGLQL